MRVKKTISIDEAIVAMADKLVVNTVEVKSFSHLVEILILKEARKMKAKDNK